MSDDPNPWDDIPVITPGYNDPEWQRIFLKVLEILESPEPGE